MKFRRLALLLLLVPAVAVTTPPMFMPPESLRQSLVPPAPAESALRRADVLFFIAIPFAVLWNTLTQTILNSVVGLRGNLLYNQTFSGASAFVMNDRGARSDVIYIAFSSMLWSGAIAWNDYLETHLPARAAVLREGSVAPGLDLHLLRLKF